MSNVITLPTRTKAAALATHYETVATYGETGPVSIALLRRLDASSGLIHVALLGVLQGVEIIASLPDNDQGGAIADLVGPAALRAVELSEVEFAVTSEADVRLARARLRVGDLGIKPGRSDLGFALHNRVLVGALLRQADIRAFQRV